MSWAHSSHSLFERGEEWSQAWKVASVKVDLHNILLLTRIGSLVQCLTSIGSLDFAWPVGWPFCQGVKQTFLQLAKPFYFLSFFRNSAVTMTDIPYPSPCLLLLFLLHNKSLVLLENQLRQEPIELIARLTKVKQDSNVFLVSLRENMYICVCFRGITLKDRFWKKEGHDDLHEGTQYIICIPTNRYTKKWEGHRIWSSQLQFVKHRKFKPQTYFSHRGICTWLFHATITATQ